MVPYDNIVIWLTEKRGESSHHVFMDSVKAYIVISRKRLDGSAVEFLGVYLVKPLVFLKPNVVFPFTATIKQVAKKDGGIRVELSLNKLVISVQVIVADFFDKIGYESPVGV